MDITNVLILIAALVTGCIVGYFVTRGPIKAADARKIELEKEVQNERERNASLEAENKRIPGLETEVARLNEVVIRPLESDRARLSEKVERIPALEKTVEAHETTLEASRITNENIRAENERLKAELKAKQENFTELQQAREDLANQFETISKRVLSTSNDSFLTLAEQKLGGELLKPLNEKLRELNLSNREMERLRTDAYATLVEQVTQLRQSDELSRQELNKLMATLESPKARGDWGEEQLRRIAEWAGMTEHCDFDVQVPLKGSDSDYRADMVVHLAGGKSIIVDAKAQWEREIFESDNPEERKLRVAAMCSNFRKHINDLWKRDYSALIPGSPDFIVMFVRVEPVFHLALQSDLSLIAYAIGKKVVLASPTTLILLLKTVAYGWQQEAISQNAQEISDLATQLYDRFAVVGGYLSDLGRNLNNSVKSYNQLVSSTESRLLVTARRFKDDYKISSKSEIEETHPVESIATFPSAPELQHILLPEAGSDGNLLDNPE
jgi:DNA recombination protein RmuC